MSPVELDLAPSHARVAWDATPLAGYRTLVTGGASGIGRAIAIGFASAGADVAVVGSPRGAERIADTVAAIIAKGRRAVGEMVDVSDDDAVRTVIDRAADQLGGLDTVVACAGVVGPTGLSSAARLADLESDQLREVLDVNVRGVWSTVRHAVPYLRDSTAAPSAITVGSVAAKRPTHGAYSVSKAAVWMASRVLSAELASERIRVNCLAPGFIDTPLFRQSVVDSFGTGGEGVTSRVPMGRIGEAEEVASAAIFLASRLSAYFTGTILNPDGGYTNVNAGG